MPKTVLFVTYGGGHAPMAAPVVRALAGDKDIRAQALALTAGGPYFKKEGLPFLGFRDFLTPGDTAALAWGRRLAATQHVAESGIEEAESVAYLGLCYAELVHEHGEAGAERLWQEKGRHAFLPVQTLGRIIDRIKPDLVVTTNSPRSEHAAVLAAQERGIPALSMTDLFGFKDFHGLTADYITVLCQPAIKVMEEEGVSRPRKAYVMTGNPAFDPVFDFRGPVDTAWRARYFPQLPAGARALLWIDVPAYFNLQDHSLHTRSEAEIIADLETMARAAGDNGGYMLIRPHPSQQRQLYDDWMRKKNYPHVCFAGGVPLYPLLNAVDAVATYASTVTVQTVLMQRPLIQLQYQPGRSNMPLGEWGLAWLARAPEEVRDHVREAFEGGTSWEQMQQRMHQLLPQEKAAPKVAALVRAILAAKGGALPPGDYGTVKIVDDAGGVGDQPRAVG